MINRLLSGAVVLLSILSLSVGLGSSASAYGSSAMNFAAVCIDEGAFFGFKSWDACLPRENGEVVINDLSDIWLVAFPIVESMIMLVGYLSVGFILWGGLTYIRSNGDPARISGARKIIQNALIGLVLSILSVSIIRFVTGLF